MTAKQAGISMVRAERQEGETTFPPMEFHKKIPHVDYNVRDFFMKLVAGVRFERTTFGL